MALLFPGYFCSGAGCFSYTIILMKDTPQILSDLLLDAFVQQLPGGLKQSFDALHDVENSTNTFSFYTSVSAMASCRIEGEALEIDIYLKHKMLKIAYQPNLVEKPNDLYQAYLHAQQYDLTKSNFLQAHHLLSAHLLPTAKRDVCCTGNMVVMKHNTFRIQ